MFKNIFIELLQKNNTNASQLAKATGIKEATLSKWKDGTMKPNYDSIQKLCAYFKVSANYLLEIETEDKNINQTVNGNISNSNGVNTVNIHKNENVSYLEMEILQEVKKLSKTEQIQLLATLNKE